MGEVERVYECVVCGRAWVSKQSLRAHMKVHNNEGYMRTSIIVLREDWAQFKKICGDRKTTECMVLRDIIKAVLAGEKQGIVTIATKNPMLVQVNHVVLGAPRGRYSHVDATKLAGIGEFPRVLCNFYGGVRPGEVYCRHAGLCLWVPWDRCKGCGQNRFRG